MRENTYWPELCLVQIADEHETRRYRPQGTGAGRCPLLDLMVNKRGCAEGLPRWRAGSGDHLQPHRQDTAPLFDTKIASMALGLGEQIGYNLVDAWMGVVLDKGARFTDWSRRPLDKRQIDYAIGDVTYLIQLFPMMLEKLRATGQGTGSTMMRWGGSAIPRITGNKAGGCVAAGTHIKPQTRMCWAA